MSADTGTRQARHQELGLSSGQCLEMLYHMKLARAFDDRAMKLYRQGKIAGLCLTQIGQEALQVGSAYCLRKDDILVPLHRDLATHFVKGQTPRKMLATYLGRENGTTRGRDGNTHHGDPSLRIFGMVSHLGTMVPVAAGMALASRMRGRDLVVMNYIGEGGANTGDVHEGLNFAAVFKLPLVLIIENNQYAYSTPAAVEYVCRRLADRAAGYGIPGEYVDGNDVLAMYEVTTRAVARARAGGGPTLIEAITFRRRGHAEHDDFSYVPKAVVKEWEEKDPIDRFERYVRGEGLLSDEVQQALTARITRELDEAVEFAERSPHPVAEQATEWVFHEPGCSCASSRMEPV